MEIDASNYNLWSSPSSSNYKLVLKPCDYFRSGWKFSLLCRFDSLPSLDLQDICKVLIFG